MRRLWWLAALCLPVFLIALAPAEWLLQRAQTRVPGLVWSGAGGSIWHGRVATLQLAGWQLQNLQWQLSPWSLLTLKPGVQLRCDGPALRAAAHLQIDRHGQLAISDLVADAPAATLAPLLRYPGIQLDGQLQARVSAIGLQLAAGAPPLLQRLDGQLEWSAASVRTPLGLGQLGGLQLQARSEADAVIVASLRDTQDLIGLQAELRWQDGALQINARARHQQAAQIANFFRLFARDNGDHYSLEWSWRPPT